jgi:hypothetical protein
MQIKKEIAPMLMLVFFCAIVVIAAGYTTTPPPQNCALSTSTLNPKPCKLIPKVHHNSPWEFITKGILHFAA